MYHMSANLAFGRREKNIWGYKKLQGGKKPIRKTEKKVATFFFFFFFFFLETVKNLWGRQKMSRGAPNGNVTPLGLGSCLEALHKLQKVGLMFPPEPKRLVFDFVSSLLKVKEPDL